MVHLGICSTCPTPSYASPISIGNNSNGVERKRCSANAHIHPNKDLAELENIIKTLLHWKKKKER